jgi:hypothetical protein
MFCRIPLIFSLVEQQLHVLGHDYLFPASTTVTATLNFAVAFLINYPEVQTNMQQELDDVVGLDRLPTLDDRARSVHAGTHSKVKLGVFSEQVCTENM